jgi:uncharacterized protein YjiS (DUF1127 family)
MEDIMVALVHAHSAPGARSIDRVRHSVLDLVRHLAEAVRREFRLRHDLAMLQSLDDTMLHDIGLSRSEIEGAVRHGRFPPL